MLILGQHGILGDIQSEVDLIISDVILLFKFFEAKGEQHAGVQGRPLVETEPFAGSSK